jgi:5-methylcytosine-specific restriction enzyme subunit McrC
VLYAATEHSILTRENRDAFSKDIILPDAAFLALQSYATREDAEQVLRYYVQRGKHCLSVGPYVGLLQASSSVGIELLPKITPDLSSESIINSRMALLRMLQTVPNLFPRTISETFLNQISKVPLPEALMIIFLRQAEKILHQGLQSDYQRRESEQPFLKGRLRTEAKPFGWLTQPGQLPVSFDERTANNAPNRLLKACLLSLRFGPYARTVRQYLFTLEDIPTTTRWQQDLQQARQQGRIFRTYTWLWPWTEWLLGGKGSGFTGGTAQLPGLLFPTQPLFENHLTTSLKRYLPAEYEVSVQDTTHHLLLDSAGKPSYRLKPDIVIRRGDTVWVLDTKWKQISTTGEAVHHLSQSDLYQLYAYGQRYLGDAKQIILGMIYPQTQVFSAAPPPHTYEPHLPLYILPANLTVAPSQMVKALWGVLEN